jgi:hypothetical protein
MVETTQIPIREKKKKKRTNLWVVVAWNGAGPYQQPHTYGRFAHIKTCLEVGLSSYELFLY